MDSSLVGAILQSAGYGTALIVVLILLGYLDPKRYTARLESEADKWHHAWEASQETITELRGSLAVQAERADQAVAGYQRQAGITERLMRVAADEAETQAARPHRRGRPGDQDG